MRELENDVEYLPYRIIRNISKWFKDWNIGKIWSRLLKINLLTIHFNSVELDLYYEKVNCVVRKHNGKLVVNLIKTD